MNRLATPRINECHRKVVPGKQTADSEDQITDSDIVQRDLNVFRLIGRAGIPAKSNSLEDRSRVETETVESDVKGKPGPGGAEKHFKVFPLAKVVAKVLERVLGQGGFFPDDCLSVVAVAIVRLAFCQHGVLGALLDVGFDVDSVAGRLGDGETEVEGDKSGHAANTDDGTPSLIHTLEVVEAFREDLAPEAGNGDDGDDAGGH